MCIYVYLCIFIYLYVEINRWPCVCVCVFGLDQNEYKIKQFYELLFMEIMSYHINFFIDHLGFDSFLSFREKPEGP